MAVPSVRRIVVSVLFAFALAAPRLAAGQTPDLVYVSNITGTEADGVALTTVETQTAAALDNLRAALRAEGLDLGDVVVSNVFLRDTRYFQGMNGVYRTYFETDPPTRATVQSDLMDPDAMIQISVVAARGPKQIVSPSGLQSPALPYSWGVKVGNTLFVSGATSRSPETYQPVTGDVPTQTRRVFGNIGMVLEEGGMGYEDLVSCKVFLDDVRRFGELNATYGTFVPEADPPARATVRAPLMNAVFSTEIQCVAVDSGDRSVVRPEARGRSPFSPAIDVGDRVYVAGVTGQGDDAASEARSALGSIETTLAAAGLTFADVENTWVFLGDIRDWDAVKAVLDETMGMSMPEPTVVGNRLVGRAVVEIQVVAKRR